MIDNGFYSASARITNIEIEMRVILCKCGILQFLVSLLLWCVCVCVCAFVTQSHAHVLHHPMAKHWSLKFAFKG